MITHPPILALCLSTYIAVWCRTVLYCTLSSSRHGVVVDCLFSGTCPGRAQERHGGGDYLPLTACPPARGGLGLPGAGLQHLLLLVAINPVGHRQLAVRDACCTVRLSGVSSLSRYLGQITGPANELLSSTFEQRFLWRSHFSSLVAGTKRPISVLC